MGKNSPEYNREYYLKRRQELLDRKSQRYRLDTSYRESCREYNKQYYIPTEERYPIKTPKGTILDENTMETPKGIYYRTEYFSAKIGCSAEFLREFIRKHNLNSRAIRYYCIKFYPEDFYDTLLDYLREDGYRVRRK